MPSLGRVLQVVLLAVPVTAYQSIANCVPGSIVKDLSFTASKIGAYTVALQAILPNLYGDLLLLGKSDVGSGTCMDAANDINSNGLLAKNVLTKYKDISQVGIFGAIANASVDYNYLYVFSNKYYINYEYIANCVPGGVVGTNLLNMTEGKIGIYTVVLQALFPNYGDLQYLSVGNTSSCLDSQNTINTGNVTYYKQLKSGKGQIGKSMDQVGLFSTLKEANVTMSYLYVFNNKDWNATYGAMDGYDPKNEETWKESKKESKKGSEKDSSGGGLAGILGSILGGSKDGDKDKKDSGDSGVGGLLAGILGNLAGGDKNKSSKGDDGDKADILGAVTGGKKDDTNATSQSKPESGSDKDEKKFDLGAILGALKGAGSTKDVSTKERRLSEGSDVFI